ncbi:MAG: TonB-dependent receptor, partial [Bacteroidota bacterium]
MRQAKVTTVLLLGLWAFQVAAQSDVLSQKVTIQFDDVPLEKAFDQLMSQTKTTINYVPSEMPKGRRITQSYDRTPLRKVIGDIWGNDQVKLKANGAVILVKSTSRTSKKAQGPDISGSVTNDDGEPIPFATVGIKGTTTGVIADEFGRFEIQRVSGPNVLIVSSAGFQSREIALEALGRKTRDLQVSLPISVSTLDEVVVEGTTFARQMALEPIAISTVDAMNLQAQTQDVARVLDKVEGVRIRQSGGLGSQTAISINGLTGNSIRFYYNGIPAEFLGGGFQLNTLPISNVDRIEVYKGVMPASIGTDALGGGINITTNQESFKALDLSYQFGSFNTHRIAGSFTQPLSNKWYFNINANYNYSDNDYEMEVQNNTYDPDLPFPTGTETITVRRFHDAFSSFLGHVNFGYDHADRQLSMNIGAYATATTKELQHGVRVGFVPFGEVDYRGQDTYLKFDLTKRFGEVWQLNYMGIGGYSRLQVEDSTQNVYDWRGDNITLINSAISRENGAELFLQPSISDIYNYNTVHRLGIGREFKHDISLNLHHFFAHQDRTGEEEIALNHIGGTDPNSIGFKITRNITSLELKKYFFSKKLELLSTAKSYQYNTKGVNTTLRGRDLTELPLTQVSRQSWGYNFAAKWTVRKDIFIRASYEDALRIPTQNEIFGDLQTIIPNFSLDPERSRNLNLGFNADLADYLKLNANYFFRSQRDLIFLQIIDLETAQFINRDRVQSAGIELSLRGEPLQNFGYSWNVTYFDIEIKEVNDIRDEFLLGSPVPNIPTFFSNLGLNYTFDDFLAED